MSREELIKQCRYYKGQDKNPFTDGEIAWFWDMERVYVRNGGKFDGENEMYKNCNFKKYDGIPFDLLMVMFTSWGKYTTDIKSNISDFYKLIDLYLEFVCDVFPKDKIPNNETI